MLDLFADLSVWSIAVIAIAALATSSIHGASGVAGGFLMSAVLAWVIGVKPVVPVMSVALLISHSSRLLLNIGDFHRGAFLLVSIPALPCIIVGALIYGKMSSTLIAVLLGIVILLSIPLRRWMKSHEIITSKTALGTVGAVYGSLSGISIGPGMLLIPFMLGYGLNRHAFVATLAAIALMTNITRVSIFGATDLLDGRFVLLGILIGLLTIPGNWIGRSILGKLTNNSHTSLVDLLTVIGALNFFWLAQ